MTLCLLQGAELSMLSVSWMHLGFLDEMQLYDLAFRVCARLGSLQTLLPVYHSALQRYMSLVRSACFGLLCACMCAEGWHQQCESSSCSEP